MKITVKPKAAPTDVYTIRIPVSLKQQTRTITHGYHGHKSRKAQRLTA
jgi:hypothetical protein